MSFISTIYRKSSQIYPLLHKQEDKEPVFDSVKAIIGMLEVSAEFAQNITFNSERIQNALPAGHLDATTLADYLVKKVSLVFKRFPLFFKIMSVSSISFSN